jgi:CheY-like chemotaxis protein
MPEMDGIQFLKEVRKIPDYIDIPIIFLSSTTNKDIINKAKQYNITKWLKKPFDLNELKKILFNLFHQ